MNKNAPNNKGKIIQNGIDMGHPNSSQHKPVIARMRLSRYKNKRLRNSSLVLDYGGPDQRVIFTATTCMTGSSAAP